MNFLFETAVNALEAFLILEFLTQYFDFRLQAPLRYIGFAHFGLHQPFLSPFFHGMNPSRFFPA